MDHKGSRLQCSRKHLRINPFSIMVYAGIHIGELDRFSGIPRKETRPDFGADPCTIAELPLVIVARAGKRWIKSVHHVETANGILFPRTNNMIHPVFAKQTRRQIVESIFLCCVEPKQLQIKIVIGSGNSGEFLRIEHRIIHFIFFFKGSPQSSSNIFPCPATINPITVFIKVQIKHL